MNVLHVTCNYPTQDRPIFGIFVKEQVDSLQSLGISCDVFFCNGKGQGGLNYLKYVPKLWWRVLSKRYDIIHCHHALSAIILLVTGWPIFKKCIVSYQNDPAHEWGLKWFRLIHLFYKKIIIKNTSNYLKYSKTYYLPNGCNTNFFRPLDKTQCREQLGLDINSVYVLYMDSNKGKRRQKRKDRYDSTLELLRNEYGYVTIESIELTNTPRELIPIYMNAVDIHLLSSDFEGSPNSVKECVFCNTPVVSTDVGNVMDMIGDIPGCYVVSEFSPKALANAVNECLNNKNKFNGRDYLYQKGYTLEDVAIKLRAIYTECINN